MKPSKKCIITTVILALFFYVNVFSQDGSTHYITLNVDTSTINSQNVNSVANFGQEEGYSNENFTISVNVGDTIIWEGVSSSSPDNDTVNITAINYKGQPNIFGENHLNGDGQSPEQVQGNVVTGEPGVVVKYTISFKVFNDGEQRGGTYHIDPKIIIKG